MSTPSELDGGTRGIKARCDGLEEKETCIASKAHRLCGHCEYKRTSCMHAAGGGREGHGVVV